jgi:2-aminobenzoate-CoA ligase
MIEKNGPGPHIHWRAGWRSPNVGRNTETALRLGMTLGIEALVGTYSAHKDTFSRERLPPAELWPTLLFDRPELRYPERVNCATVLLDAAVSEGHGDRVAIYSEARTVSYRELLSLSNRLAWVLLEEGVVPGNRVLLRGVNSVMLCAAWLAVMKVGAIAVTTMPLLRAKELAEIGSCAAIDHALCESSLIAELDGAAAQTGRFRKVLSWGAGELEARIARADEHFENIATAACDVCLLAFTSGTTGRPKATMHFHRDILVICDTVARHVLKTDPADIYVGSPPLGFTFGLGALLLFPLRFRAAAVMVEHPTASALLEAVQRHRATCLFTAPTMYKHLASMTGQYDLSSLRRSVSAGEPLPRATYELWREATGIRLIDGLGSTEMLHIFISASPEESRPGATGRPVPGYEAMIIDDEGQPLPAGPSGRLAVRGPTGCRYLADPRQRDYVLNGWNLTGDRYRMDEDGYFWFESRTDDLIISAGYNIAGPEVEAALLSHPAVREVAVIGVPDEDRGHIAKAFIVLEATHVPSEVLVKALQDHVKQSIAPYKYPRAIEFMTSLPKGPSGKLQRFRLRGPPRSDR